MHIVLVNVHVKPDKIEEFRIATIDNARNSLCEEGVLRFDFLQQTEDPARFMLVEVYKNKEDQEKHRETSHYIAWKEIVANMMAESRQGLKYINIFPDDNSWKKP